MSLTPTPSTRAGKKWSVRLPDGRTVHYGDPAYEDYTQHGDRDRLARYLARHRRREDWSDPRTAGFWSRWHLWNDLSDDPVAYARERAVAWYRRHAQS